MRSATPSITSAFVERGARFLRDLLDRLAGARAVERGRRDDGDRFRVVELDALRLALQRDVGQHVDDEFVELPGRELHGDPFLSSLPMIDQARQVSFANLRTATRPVKPLSRRRADFTYDRIGSEPQRDRGAGVGPDHPASRRRLRRGVRRVWSRVDGPAAVARGLLAITTSRDTLLTDYFGIGGIGAGCVNAGLLTLCACFIYHRTGAKMSGASVACLFLVLGFALFGKNLLNVWPIVFGVALYSRFKGEPFATNINTAFFGVALAPIFSEILFSGLLTAAVSVPLAIATGLLIGFVLAPAAAQLAKAHMGFSLYNMGFTAGLVGTLVVALYKSYGFVPDPVFVWTTGNNLLLGSFLALVFASMIAIGFGSTGACRPG
jgi:hypothetical protein